MTARLDAVRARLQPVIDDLAAGVVDRDRLRQVPAEHIARLADAGIGRIRVPVEAGGDGLDIRELATLLIELAAVDANVPQIIRGHIAFVEDLLQRPDSEHRDAWFARLVGGALVGNAWSEVGDGAIGRQQTTLGDTVDGRKFYTTGSIVADWIDVLAQRGDAQVCVLVDRWQRGVTVFDDWDGFGQRGTGTGTAVFEGAAFDERDVVPVQERFGAQTAVYQLVLLAVLAGVAAAAERDAAGVLAARRRVYSHGAAERAGDDPQLLQAVGEVSSVAAVARAAVLDVADAVGAALHGGARVGEPAAIAEAEHRSAQAQVVLSGIVPAAATRIFDALGASATSSTLGLDRHWRNARTVASHNPWVYKARIVGDRAVNGTLADPLWAIGVGSAST